MMSITRSTSLVSHFAQYVLRISKQLVVDLSIQSDRLTSAARFLPMNRRFIVHIYKR